MKNQLVIVLLTLLTCSVYSQNLERQLIGSTGGLSSGSSATLSYSVGEAVTETFSSSSIILNQGFQQGYADEQTSVERITNAGFNILVYPNPADDYLIVHWNGVNEGSIYLTVTDISGRKVNAFNVNHLKKTRISTDMLEQGIYILSVKTPDGLYTIKFIKK